MKERFSETHWSLILDILQNGRNLTWFELAEKFNIKPDGSYQQRVKASNDIWRRFTRLTNKDNIDLTTIKQTLNKDGEIVFETKVLKEEVPEIHPSILEGKRIKRVTINPYGKPWVTYEAQKEESLDNTNIKEELIEAFKNVLGSEGVACDFNFSNQMGNSLFADESLEDDLLVYTSDKHIGASVEENSIYQNKYDERVFRRRMNKIALKIQKAGSKDNLIIFDLGDALDGFNAQTTRGGHTLPQNMNNKEQFETYLKIHKEFFENILSNGNKYNQISFICASNSNHGGDFDYMAMKAFELILKNMCPQIHIKVSEKFIDHIEVKSHKDSFTRESGYIIGPTKYTVIFTHGKDDADMKHGFPLVLNDKVENYINNYIDYHSIDARKPIHFIKGDLHQSATQYAKRFRYKNVGSIFGSSKWIHTNFGNTKPICDMDIIEQDSINEIRLFL